MKLGNTPRPAPWSPPLASPSASVDPYDELIQLPPSSCGSDFMVNVVSKMVGCGGHRRRELLIDRGATRSKGGPNRNKKPWAHPTRPAGPGPFWVGLGPSSSQRLIFTFCTWPPSFVSFSGRHPRDQDRVSSCMKSKLYVLVLRDDPS
jgi:hypothetical protein